MLSAEQLSEIASAFKFATGSETSNQNRRAHRVQHSGKTTIFRLARKANESALLVQMRDISARGCSFTVKEKLAREANFVIQFSRRNRPPVSVLCTVMHCRSAGDCYRIGAEFTCLVDVQRAARLAGEDTRELDRIRSSILG